MSKEQIIAIVVVIYIIIHSAFIEPNMIKVTKYEVANSSLAGVKIVFFSDLHAKRNDYNRMNKIVALINKQQADLVISGGDYAPSKYYKDMMDIESLGQKLSMINAPVYSVLGEYDWYANGEEIAKGLQKNRIRILENAGIVIPVRRKRVSLIGYADFTTRTVKTAKAIRGTTKPRILITHNPDIYYNVIDKYDLILAGHTHGGQIIIPFAPPLFSVSKYKFNKGIMKPGQNTMIVTSGLGQTGIQARFNCPPEIVVINFVKETR